MTVYQKYLKPLGLKICTKSHGATTRSGGGRYSNPLPDDVNPLRLLRERYSDDDHSNRYSDTEHWLCALDDKEWSSEELDEVCITLATEYGEENITYQEHQEKLKVSLGLPKTVSLRKKPDGALYVFYTQTSLENSGYYKCHGEASLEAITDILSVHQIRADKLNKEIRTALASAEVPDRAYLSWYNTYRVRCDLIQKWFFGDTPEEALRKLEDAREEIRQAIDSEPSGFFHRVTWMHDKGFTYVLCLNGVPLQGEEFEANLHTSVLDRDYLEAKMLYLYVAETKNEPLTKRLLTFINQHTKPMHEEMKVLKSRSDVWDASKAMMIRSNLRSFFEVKGYLDRILKDSLEDDEQPPRFDMSHK